MKAIMISLFVFMSLSLEATILIVDNNIPSSSQYTTLQAAHNVAANGDTIYVVPSNTAYAALIVSKHLHLIGAGWLSQGNDGVFIKSTRIFGSMTFQQDADGSSICGFGGDFSIKTYADNTTIEKCYLDKLDIGLSGYTYTAYNTLVINNYFNSSNYIIAIWHNSNTHYSFQLVNNVMITYSGGYGIYTYGVPINGSCIISNNTIVASPLTQSGTDYPDAIVINNIITSDLLTSQSIHDNISGAIAVDCITPDYHTVAGSAAIDAGNPNMAFNDLDGTRNDCGAYGGPTPFVDGGIPGLPAIYEINGPGVATPNETIPIQIKARTNRD